ncbi:MAG: NAD(P)-dependent dehydrogenase (short-subunit alcohol dehydrogenase family) [Glaciecola sp.]|jgi:NAD(P)-dependent dehydrogenase (short-subunit alcohol dehydrogenase family)|uniref:SDR family NAD(P)-dependent oxidoreductase n=1 Tax=Congregibacter sp. TaxID=2744308 RepID=UPI0039E43529
MGNISNKVALCTGAGSEKGIGAGILMHLAKQGYRIVVSDLGENSGPDSNGTATQAMQNVVARITALGSECVAIPCDVRDDRQVTRLFDETIDTFGQIDVLINNAGIGYLMKAFVDVPVDEWRLVMDVNLTGTFLCSQEAAKRMIDAGNGGRIINIASQAAKTGFPHLAAYVASKHGLVGLTRSNACELGEHGITVNAVCPNHITTELGARQNEYYAELQGLTVPEYLAAMKNRIPMKRHCTAQDVAAMVAFLASDDASYITGEALNVSGGEETH